MNYGKHVSTKNTPQTQPIPGRIDQVKNNAGGYVFEVSDSKKLERFLTIGSEGGTFYVGEDKLTQDNAKNIIQMIRNNGESVIDAIENFADNNRAPKLDPLIFVLALATTYGNAEVKSKAYTLVSKVCRTATHLFTFIANIQELRGWSRGLRSGVAKWYTSKTVDQVAYQLVKYRQRNGWTHRDVLRLSHPKSTDEQKKMLFSYVVGKPFDGVLLTPLPKVFEAVQASKNIKDIVGFIKEYKLTWEMLPTEVLKEKVIWEALLESMPLTAMIRNLGKMTSLGLFESKMSANTTRVVKALTNKEVLKKANVHPVNILNSMKVYAQGHGDKGSLTWSPSGAIVDALQEAFELSYETVEPTGKKILVAVDVSGSMSTGVSKMALSAKEVAAALSLTMIKTEPNVDVIWFDTKVYKPTIGKRTEYNTLVNHTPNGGGTDCSLAFMYAVSVKDQVKYDAIVVLTDNETWAGKRHTSQTLDDYKKINPNVKSICVGMTATDYGVIPTDYNTLHVAGFDAGIPKFINNFIQE